MADRIDWTLATYEGNRRRQHEEFLALTFREKLAVIEELDHIARHFSRRHAPEDATRRPPHELNETHHG